MTINLTTFIAWGPRKIGELLGKIGSALSKLALTLPDVLGYWSRH